MKEGIIYFCIYEKLISISDGDIISKKEFSTILGRIYHIPKKYKVVVMKEMEQLGMIENLGSGRNNNLKIKKIQTISPNTSKLYRNIGLF